MDPGIAYILLFAIGVAIERAARAGVPGFSALAIGSEGRQRITVPERRGEIEPVGYRERRERGLRGGLLAGPATIDDGVVLVRVSANDRAMVRDARWKRGAGWVPMLRLVATVHDARTLELRAYTLPRFIVPFGLPVVVGGLGLVLGRTGWFEGLVAIGVLTATLAMFGAFVGFMQSAGRGRLHEIVLTRAATLLAAHVERAALAESGQAEPIHPAPPR